MSFSELSTPLIAYGCLRRGVSLRLAPPGIAAVAAGAKIAGRALPARHYGSVDVFLEAFDAALLEAAPEGMSVKEIGDAIAAHRHVESLHDLHIWEVSPGFPALSAHVLVHEGDDCHAMRRELEQMLEERFKIEHTTLQVDHSTEGQLITIGSTTPRAPH